MPKLSTKLSIIFSLLLVVVLVFTNTILDIAFFPLRENLLKEAQHYLNKNIWFEDINFIFPNRLVFRNAFISQKYSPDKKQLIFIPRVVAHVSFFKLFQHHQVSLSYLLFDEPRIHLENSVEFLRKELVHYIDKMPKQNFTFALKNGLLIDEKDTRGPFYTLVNVRMMMRGASFEINGKFEEKRESYLAGSLKDSSLLSNINFMLKGTTKNNQVALEKLILSNPYGYVNLWGDMNKSDIHLKGYVLMDDRHQKNMAITKEARLWKDLNRLFVLKRPPRIEAQALSAKHYLLNINTSMKLNENELIIGRLGFHIDDIPINIRGAVFFDDPLSFSLSMNLYPQQSLKGNAVNMKKVDINITGAWEDKIITTQGGVKMYFDKRENHPILEHLEFSFKDLVANLEELPRLTLSFKQAEILCCSDSYLYEFSLKDAKSLINVENELYKFMEFESSLYEGSLKARVGVNTSQEPFDMTASGMVRNVNIGHVTSLIDGWPQLKGRLDGNLFFQSRPFMDVRGNIHVVDAEVDKASFLVWVSDYFDVPLLKTVKASQASSDFFVNPQTIVLDNISVDGSGFSAKGYFRLNNHNAVASQLSFLIGRNMIENSQHFKPLLKIIDKEFDPIPLDFKLSGNLKAVNFQWNTSDLKKQLQEKIPNFIERHIEEEIEETLQESSLKE